MSSARRLQEDYRRIIGLQDETRGLDDDLPRMRIGGERGIWQIGNNELKTGSAGGEDEDGNAINPVTPDEGADNSNSDGTGGGGGGGTDPANPLDPEIINPEDPPTGVDVNSDTFGSNWASGGVKSFVDCDSGKCIELVETRGFVPPEGWDDADDPPPDPEWVSGFRWQSTTFGVLNGATPRSVFSQMPDRYPDLQDDYYKISYNWNGVSNSASVLYRTDGNAIINVVMQRMTCTPSAESLICPINAPTLEFWPSDNCIQLAPNAEGNWQASPRESPDDMTAKYSEAKSILNVCNQSGEPIDIYQRVGGGFVYFNQTQGIWAGSDSSGRIRSFGSSSTLDQEIARPRN